MDSNIVELENKIEKKIIDLEREKSRLKDDLVIIRKASAIAGEFHAAGSDPQWTSEDSNEEHRGTVN